VRDAIRVKRYARNTVRISDGIKPAGDSFSERDGDLEDAIAGQHMPVEIIDN
jgi:hypothetical protein